MKSRNLLRRITVGLGGFFMCTGISAQVNESIELPPAPPDSVVVELPSLPFTPGPLDRTPLVPNDQLLPDLGLNTMINSEGIRIVPENLQLPSPFRASHLHSSRNAFLGPYRYSYQNWLQGGDMVGLGGSYRVSDRFTVGGQAYISSAYFGIAQPTRQWNGTLGVNAGYWVTDWMMVYGHGQYSVSEGMNPNFMSPVGGGKSYGGGVQFKISNGFGVGVGVTREYWMGKWHTNYQYYPIFYK